jgi:hypothetical protein
MKTSLGTLATKGLAVTSRQRTISTLLFHQGISDQKQRDCHPHPIYFSLFPLLKIKLKGHHFDTIEVMETELQIVLNTPQKTISEMHLKKW